MEHNSARLARPCNANDIFISGAGLQCGNCLAYEETPAAPAWKLWHCTYQVTTSLGDSFLWQDWVLSTSQPTQRTIGHYFKTGFPGYTVSREACELDTTHTSSDELHAGHVDEQHMIDTRTGGL